MPSAKACGHVTKSVAPGSKNWQPLKEFLSHLQPSFPQCPLRKDSSSGFWQISWWRRLVLIPNWQQPYKMEWTWADLARLRKWGWLKSRHLISYVCQLAPWHFSQLLTRCQPTNQILMTKVYRGDSRYEYNAYFSEGGVLVKKLFLDYKRWETRHGCENTEHVGNLLSMVVSLELVSRNSNFQFHPMGYPWQAASNHFCQPPQNMHHNPCTCALHRGTTTSWLLGQAWKRLILFSRWKQGVLKIWFVLPKSRLLLTQVDIEVLNQTSSIGVHPLKAVGRISSRHMTLQRSLQRISVLTSNQIKCL